MIHDYFDQHQHDGFYLVNLVALKFQGTAIAQPFSLNENIQSDDVYFDFAN